MDDIKRTVKSWILEEFLPGQSPEKLEDTTPLITQGILDSLATLKLVSFLEGTYGIRIQAHEVGVDNMNSIADIASFVESKRG